RYDVVDLGSGGPPALLNAWVLPDRDQELSTAGQVGADESRRVPCLRAIEAERDELAMVGIPPLSCLLENHDDRGCRLGDGQLLNAVHREGLPRPLDGPVEPASLPIIGVGL